MANRLLTAKTDYGVAFAEVDGETDTYQAALDGSNLATETDYSATDYLIGLRSDGVPKGVPIENIVSNIHFYLQGGPDQAVTASDDYCLVIPVGAAESNTQFTAGGSSTIRIMGVSLCAEFYSGDIITGSTTIRVSNKKKEASGASYVDCSLTNTSADTDRRNSTAGTFEINTTSEALYIHYTAVGGHGAINGWVWTRREAVV